MTKTLKALALGAAVATLPLAASALTTLNGSGVAPASSGTVGLSGDTVSFDWSSSPFSAYLDFTVDATFDLIFDSYTPSSSDARSGLVLINQDTTTRLTFQNDACGGAMTEIAGLCAFISAGTAADNYSAGETIFVGLGAGDYRIGLYESSVPADGFASFSVVSEISAIPLPAGAALLITAIGGLAALRRRQAAAPAA